MSGMEGSTNPSMSVESLDASLSDELDANQRKEVVARVAELCKRKEKPTPDPAKLKPERLCFINKAMYNRRELFNDVMEGGNSNGFHIEKNCAGVKGAQYWSAIEGWDPVTGLGTPIFSKLLAAAMAAGDKSVAAAEM